MMCWDYFAVASIAVAADAQNTIVRHFFETLSMLYSIRASFLSDPNMYIVDLARSNFDWCIAFPIHLFDRLPNANCGFEVIYKTEIKENMV